MLGKNSPKASDIKWRHATALAANHQTTGGPGFPENRENSREFLKI